MEKNIFKVGEHVIGSTIHNCPKEVVIVEKIIDNYIYWKHDKNNCNFTYALQDGFDCNYYEYLRHASNEEINRYNRNKIYTIGDYSMSSNFL